MKFKYISILLLSLYPFLFGCNNKKSEFVSDEGMVWNTQFHITFQGPESLKDSIRVVLDEVGHSLSVFNPTSLVSRVNRNDSVALNNDFVRVFEMSKKIHSLSGGTFDPTLSPLITAWGFGPGHTPTSDTLRIDSLLSITGLDKTEIKDSRLIKKAPEIQFNFSAIAKGYGCDRIGEMFKRNGVEDFMVEIGGEIALSGMSPRGSDWNISIDRPIYEADSVIHESQVVVSLTGCGIATSGNYRNFHLSGNRILGHTISPETGRPVQTDILSATVIASTAMEADALATAFMALGSKKAKEIILGRNIAALLIFAESSWASPSFEKLIAH